MSYCGTLKIYIVQYHEVNKKSNRFESWKKKKKTRIWDVTNKKKRKIGMQIIQSWKRER